MQKTSLAATQAFVSLYIKKPKDKNLYEQQIWENLLSLGKWADTDWMNMFHRSDTELTKIIDAIGPIRVMFEDMGFSEEQIDMFIEILISQDISIDVKTGLVEAWNKYHLLKPFEDDVLFLHNNNNLVENSLISAKMKFQKYAAECLPLIKDSNDVIPSLIKARESKEIGQKTTALLSILMPDDNTLDTSTSELQVFDENNVPTVSDVESQVKDLQKQFKKTKKYVTA